MIADWLRSLPIVRLEDKYIITHGGIPKGMDMNDLVRILTLMDMDSKEYWQA